MDDTAFLFELSRVENKLMSYAMSLTRYYEDDAQELFQATVVRAYMKKGLFTPGTRFDLWIGRIMKNVYLNELVAAQRNTTFDKEYSLAYSHHFIDCRLEFGEVCALIDCLPHDISLPLRMYADGYKYHEIAYTLGIPMSSVKNRIRAARIHLRRLLDE
jgi:RNA polymerase sigma-70 factor (ECF subfamily)